MKKGPLPSATGAELKVLEELWRRGEATIGGLRDALYPEGGPFLRLIGGTFNGHGPLERFRVIVLDHDHPITRGVDDFEVADEQHTPGHDHARVHLLLESRSSEGTAGAAGWAHQPGRGRVCYLTNGHTREAQDHPEFQRLVRNAALWNAKFKATVERDRCNAERLTEQGWQRLVLWECQLKDEAAVRSTLGHFLAQE